ncbi:amidase [Nocardioides silvaticus]|uniref:Amidase n=1 Tax=Nocardioides silvaticus TaxID=2201891 RepID=A0A316TMG7_9ACTN|nr:amidase [Nocardioides silvaticus]PWN04195.1 amidase [Nocardioides silvaticus]
MTTLGAAETADRIRAGELTAGQAVEDCLAAIDDRNPELNGFSVVLAERARKEAAERDAAAAPLGPLHGVPIAIKEENDVAGCVTTFGGRSNTTPAEADSAVVRRLRAAGAVIVGKTSMPEFGAWPYTEPLSLGPARNPWHTAHTPGGSSGGTAVAVASGMVPAAIGGDGGGSIRIPASFCGLFGLKPQRGRVTTAPNPHLWWALGTLGPLTRTVLDSALVYDAINGGEPGDLFQAGEAGSFVEAARREPGRLRIGWTVKGTAPGVRPHPLHVEAVEDTARLLTDLGHDVRPLDVRLPDPTAAFVPQFFAGLRTEADAVEHYERLEPSIRQAYRLGSWVRPGVVDWALRQTEKVSEKANRAFDGYDVLLTPVTANRPPRVGVLKGVNVLTAALKSQPAITYTALWNVTGNPAAAVPCGLGTDGLPLSVQLVGRLDDEPTLLSLSAQIEAARPWPLVAER